MQTTVFTIGMIKMLDGGGHSDRTRRIVDSLLIGNCACAGSEANVCIFIDTGACHHHKFRCGPATRTYLFFHMNPQTNTQHLQQVSRS